MLVDYLRDQSTQPGDISAGTGKAGDELGPDWIATGRHDDGDRARRFFGGTSRLLALRHDDVNLELDQLGGESRESREFALCPSVLECDGLSLHVPSAFSLKRVLPALVPELPYEGLTIADGATASLELERLLFDRGELEKEARGQIRSDLLAYCRQDTFGLLKLLKRLEMEAVQ